MSKASKDEGALYNVPLPSQLPTDSDEMKVFITEKSVVDLSKGIDITHAFCSTDVSSSRTDDDTVVNPSHYNCVPAACGKCSGPIECIDVVQHFNFNRGNVIKYVWRADDKGNPLEDLRKARQYLDFEIARLDAQ